MSCEILRGLPVVQRPTPSLGMAARPGVHPALSPWLIRGAYDIVRRWEYAWHKRRRVGCCVFAAAGSRGLRAVRQVDATLTKRRYLTKLVSFIQLPPTFGRGTADFRQGTP